MYPQKSNARRGYAQRQARRKAHERQQIESFSQKEKTMNTRREIPVWAILLAILAIVSLCCVSLVLWNPIHLSMPRIVWSETSTQPTQAPAATQVPIDNDPAPEPQITPDNTFEVQCHHQNAGKFSLLSGYSINGGHVWVKGVEYLFVDDRVVVVTNNSDKDVEVNSTDGVGVCNDTNYDRQVKIRLSEGCDSNGCSEVKWINITNDGVKIQVIKK